MISKVLKQNKIIPIIRYFNMLDIEERVSTLYNNGINVIELSLTNPNSYKAIELLKSKFPNLIVGAGTVIKKQQIIKLKQINVDFMISPGTSQEIIIEARKAKIPLLPGIFSPSDIMIGFKEGIKFFKIFPISEISNQFIKAMKGPFPNIKFIGVGGIDEKNIKKYLEMVESVGIGSYLFPKSILDINVFKERVKGIMKW